MTPEQIERMRKACVKAKEAATEIESLADDLDDYAEKHDARESARIIGDEADVTAEWMNRISVKTHTGG